jgi:hypothetical protein
MAALHIFIMKRLNREINRGMGIVPMPTPWGFGANTGAAPTNNIMNMCNAKMALPFLVLA